MILKWGDVRVYTQYTNIKSAYSRKLYVRYPSMFQTSTCSMCEKKDFQVTLVDITRLSMVNMRDNSTVMKMSAMSIDESIKITIKNWKQKIRKYSSAIKQKCASDSIKID